MRSLLGISKKIKIKKSKSQNGFGLTEVRPKTRYAPNPNAKRNVLGAPVMVTFARFFLPIREKLALSIRTSFNKVCTIYLEGRNLTLTFYCGEYRI